MIKSQYTIINKSGDWMLNEIITASSSKVALKIFLKDHATIFGRKSACINANNELKITYTDGTMDVIVARSR